MKGNFTMWATLLFQCDMVFKINDIWNDPFKTFEKTVRMNFLSEFNLYNEDKCFIMLKVFVLYYFIPLEFKLIKPK